jgi:hypothetical protein
MRQPGSVSVSSEEIHGYPKNGTNVICCSPKFNRYHPEIYAAGLGTEENSEMGYRKAHVPDRMANPER